jgi:hypothetical protein
LVLISGVVLFDIGASCARSVERPQEKGSRDSDANCVSGRTKPDFDGEGHLRGKFEAGTAHRIDQEHIGFQHLKITTYTPENQPDLQIDMHTSVLDLKTRVLSSQERTTIQRADFNIAGDSVYFDTNTKTGRLIGNVKMVITDQSHLTAKPNSSE